MSKEDSHIDTRTPEEMYTAYYTRTISIGEAVKRNRLIVEFSNTNNEKYFFDFDRDSLYRYSYTSENRFFHYFSRLSDGETLTMTRYSIAPIKK